MIFWRGRLRSYRLCLDVLMDVSFVLAWCSRVMAAVAKVVVRARRLRVTGVALMPHGV